MTHIMIWTRSFLVSTRYRLKLDSLISLSSFDFLRCMMSDGSGSIDLNSIASTTGDPRWTLDGGSVPWLFSYNPCIGFSSSKFTNLAVPSCVFIEAHLGLHNSRCANIKRHCDAYHQKYFHDNGHLSALTLIMMIGSVRRRYRVKYYFLFRVFVETNKYR